MKKLSRQRQTKIDQPRLKAFRKVQFEKPPVNCPTCGKELKYETNVFKSMIANELRKNEGINVKRKHIHSAATCCDVGWVKFRE